MVSSQLNVLLLTLQLNVYVFKLSQYGVGSTIYTNFVCFKCFKCQLSL